MLSLSRWLRQVVARAVARPVAVVAVTALAALVGGGLALGLRPSADPSNLVDRGSATFRDTERFHQRFGDDAVLILAREDLLYLLLTSDLGRLLGLEGCLSGNAPPGIQPPGGPPRGPCAALARDKPARVVYG